MCDDEKLVSDFCKKWVKDHDGWLEGLAESRRQKDGFAFSSLAGNATYEEFVDTLGRHFHDVITDRWGPYKSIACKRAHMAFSEKHEHVLHSAAVLWLERRERSPAEEHADGAPVASSPAKWKEDYVNTLGDRSFGDYESELKYLWVSAVLKSDKTDKDRREAMVRYLWSHSTLGKVIVRHPTRFHEDRSIETLPGYWGLFLFSARWSGDHGSYGDGQRVHEQIPRKFNDASTPEGLYLHRSKAHGRDEHLALAQGSGDGRHCLVACVKGVGADLSLLPRHVLNNYPGREEGAERDWRAESSLLPFFTAEGSKVTGSWFTIGYCFTSGSIGEGETEIATVDFENFRRYHTACTELADRFPANRCYRYLPLGAVEPYVCIELNCRPKTLELLRDGVKGSKEVGFPAQVVTCAPMETSLRIWKEGTDQDYDYNDIDLELIEWERCYESIVIDDCEALINADIIELQKEYLSKFAAFRDAIEEAYEYDKMVEAQQKNLDQQMSKALETHMKGLDPDGAKNVEKTNERMARRIRLAYRAFLAVLGSYVVFAHRGWASDRSTGSFSGRNFNSGPRDSNQWGEGALADGGSAVDARGLQETLAPGGKLYSAIGLGELFIDEGDAARGSKLVEIWGATHLATASLWVNRLCAEILQKSPKSKKDLCTAIVEHNEKSPPPKWLACVFEVLEESVKV